MSGPTNAETAAVHLKQYWMLPRDDEARPEHLTAALVYAVLAVNDTLREFRSDIDLGKVASL